MSLPMFMALVTGTRSSLGATMEERDSCFLALVASCSIISRSTSRAFFAAFLFLRYCRCLRSNCLEGCLAKLVGIRDWSRVMVVERVRGAQRYGCVPCLFLQKSEE